MSEERQGKMTLVFGLLPVANIICEKPSIVSLLVFNDKVPSADFVIAWGDSSAWNSIPLTAICSARKSLICRAGKVMRIKKTIPYLI